MRRPLPAAAAAAAFALLALAGCAAPAPTVTADFITPGVWSVRGSTDYMYAWAHNPGAGTLPLTWSLTLAGNAPLPAGWKVTFAPAGATLSPAGTKEGRSYPDWAATLITLTLPANEPAGNRTVELHAGDTVKSETLSIAATRGKVSGPGSKVNVHYDGRFEDDNTRFDTGDFPTTLGSGQTVPGFDNGLMGLAPGETASLHIPPAFAYGYDNPAGNYAKFNGRTLLFIVTMTNTS